MGAEVFVSYSSQDRDRVIPVVDYLRSSGISVWVDEGNIHAADLWSEQIVQAIAGCQVMVVMLSGNSTDSHNVVKEAMLASEQKKALLPVYLESSGNPGQIAIPVSRDSTPRVIRSRGRAGSVRFGDGSEEAGSFGWRR